MIEILKKLILDFQEMELANSIPRQLQMKPVPGKVAVCMGVRRSGKSTYMFQMIQQLLDSGVPREDILYLNFFDDRLHGLRHSPLQLVSEAYYSLYPEKKGTEMVYAFFDEIQVIPDWESFVDRLNRTEKIQLTLTGSSANMLSREIATQMRGRALSWELFPFSFKEYLDGKGINNTLPLSSKRELMVQKAFNGYWETGGFPEVLGLDSRLRIRIHQEYFHALLYRDLIERYDISHGRAVLDLAHRLVTDTASLYTINRLTGYLKSLGHKVPKSAVSDYLKWFEDAYFLFTTHIFDPSVAKRKTNPKKIYCIDHALTVSVGSGILLNSGHVLENMVFAELRKKYQEIFYYRTLNGREVDFIVPLRGGSRMLVQVCESLSLETTRKREMAALVEAMEEQNVRKGTIVTRNETERITTRAGDIEVLPVWKFLLNNGDKQS